MWNLIYKVYTDYDYSIISPHRNAIITDEERNEVSNHDLDKDSKPDLFTIQCTKYLFNDPLNLNISTISTPQVIILHEKAVVHLQPFQRIPYQNVKKKIQPVGISHKEGNRTKEYHLTSFHK